MQNLSSSQTNLFAAHRQALGAELIRQDSILYHLLKRVLDMSITLLGLLTLWPIFLLIAVLIKLDSPGPIFFVQQRVGARRREQNSQFVWEVQPFYILKFRSMIHNADESLHVEHIKAYVSGDLDANDVSDDPKFKLADDPRITRVGHFIRKTSLDELPQLWNVLKGEMSLVGPRPVPLYEAELYQPEHYERLMALPGLTGLWQVEGRGEVTFDEMMRLDIEYVRKRTIWLDLMILIRTIPAAFFGQGAA